MNFQTNFDYLKPPPQVFQIKHSEFYIKHGEGTKHVRKIFCNVNYDDFEKNFLQEFKKIIEKNKIILPPSIEEKDLLIYSYNSHFNLELCFSNFKFHLDWLNNPIYHTMTDYVFDILQKGIFYNFGVDRQFRPLIFISFPSDLKKYQLDDLLAAICILLNTIKKQMFIPGCVENWVILMEASNIGMSTLSNLDIIKKIINVMSVNFTCTLEKQYIMNPPFMVRKAWSVIEKFINPETALKINFLSKKDFPKMFDIIDPNQLEMKYGGNLPNLTEFWPPKLTPLQAESLKQNGKEKNEKLPIVQSLQKFKSFEYEEIVFEMEENRKENKETEICFSNFDKGQDDSQNENFYDFDDSKTYFYFPPNVTFKLKE